MAQEKLLFHQKNVKINKCVVAFAKYVELGYGLLPHLPHSMDLALGDYFLFPNLNKSAHEEIFGVKEEIIIKFNTYFKNFDQFYYLDVVKEIEECWMNCLKLKND